MKNPSEFGEFDAIENCVSDFRERAKSGKEGDLANATTTFCDELKELVKAARETAEFERGEREGLEEEVESLTDMRTERIELAALIRTILGREPDIHLRRRLEYLCETLERNDKEAPRLTAEALTPHVLFPAIS